MTTTMRRLGVITGAVALFLIVIWYFALFHPQSKSLAKAHSDRAAAEHKAQTLQQQVVQLNALKRQIPSDTAKLGIYSLAVPDNPQLPSALQSIQQIASGAGVVINSLNPTNATSRPGGAGASGTPSIPLTMNVTGTYAQLTNFMTALSALPRTYVIQNLNVSQSGNALTASITGAIYYAGKPTP